MDKCLTCRYKYYNMCLKGHSPNGCKDEETIEYYKEFLEVTPDDNRECLVNKYAWAIPDGTALHLIQRYSPIVEIGAGQGYWASFIDNIVCYDLKPNGRVKYGTPCILENYASHTLMLCWPPYDISMAHNSLMIYKGEHLIYIGEGYDGCTGDNKFHDALRWGWEVVVRYNIPQWKHIHDNLTIYKRK